MTDPTAADLVRQYAALVDDFAAAVAQLATMRAAERERHARLMSAIAESNDRLKAANAALGADIAKGATI